jgi:hypothetical protein
MSTASQPSQEPAQRYLLALEKHWGVKRDALKEIGRSPNSLAPWRESPEFSQREEQILLQVNRKQKQIVLDSISAGMDLDTASTHAHTTRTTVLKWRKEDPDFDSAVLIAVNAGLKFPESAD